VARTIVAVVKAAAENSDWRLLDTRLLFDAADHAARSATSLRPFAPPAWPVAPARKASVSGIRARCDNYEGRHAELG